MATATAKVIENRRLAGARPSTPKFVNFRRARKRQAGERPFERGTKGIDKSRIALREGGRPKSRSSLARKRSLERRSVPALERTILISAVRYIRRDVAREEEDRV